MWRGAGSLKEGSDEPNRRYELLKDGRKKKGNENNNWFIHSFLSSFINIIANIKILFWFAIESFISNNYYVSDKTSMSQFVEKVLMKKYVISA